MPKNQFDSGLDSELKKHFRDGFRSDLSPPPAFEAELFSKVEGLLEERRDKRERQTVKRFHFQRRIAERKRVLGEFLVLFTKAPRFQVAALATLVLVILIPKTFPSVSLVRPEDLPNLPKSNVNSNWYEKAWASERLAYQKEVNHVRRKTIVQY